MKKYNHLSLEEREHIYALKESGKSLRKIALELGRNVSTISRELDNKTKYIYLPCRAHETAYKRKRDQRVNAPKKSEDLWEYVRSKLELKWSPETISGRLPIDYPYDKSMRVSYETIYEYIYKEGRKYRLWKKLAQHKYKRTAKTGRKIKTRGKVPNSKSITKRPKGATKRTRYGHMETDLAEGKKGSSVISTTVDRKSKYIILTKIRNKTSKVKQEEQVKTINQFPQGYIKSVTADNGSENYKHTVITDQTNVPYYFCHAYSSYEKGTVENSIGRFRRYYPKGTDFNKVPYIKIKQVQNIMNNTPRKCLKYRTPKEVMLKSLSNYTNSKQT